MSLKKLAAARAALCIRKQAEKSWIGKGPALEAGPLG